MKKIEKIIVLLIALVVVVWLFIVWSKEKAAKVAESVGEALNPTSHENIFNKAVNSVGESVTGKAGWTLGGAIYDFLHKDDELREQAEQDAMVEEIKKRAALSKMGDEV